ncbi:MAG: 30S ribosome-binding factor RbfA [Planctomycetota bacterium]|jgi:ribosome-binding factor A
MSQRTAQVASLIRKAVQNTLSRGLHDDRVRGLISVTKVSVGADLAQATVHVSVMPEEYAELTLQGLRHAAPRLRAELGRAVRLRRTPRLSFELDQSIKKQAALDAALVEARRLEGRPSPSDPPENDRPSPTEKETS